jgi:hypothetical protein
LFEPVINSAGRTAFYGGLSDGTVGLWSEGSGSLRLVTRDGGHAPGTPDGVNHSFEQLRDFYPDLPMLNDAGQTAFYANIAGNGVNNTNDWGVWSESSGSLALVARSGSPAPGTPEGVNFDSLIGQTGFNDAGQTAVFAYVTGSGVDPSNDNGIWSEGSGSLKLVARSGSPAPGTSSGVNFQDFVFPPVDINNAGQIAFQAALIGNGVDQTNDDGIWSDRSGTLELVARRGSPAPGTASGVDFDAFSLSSWPVLNDAGQIAFRCHLTGIGVNATNNLGIWVERTDALELVARTGSPAPGTPSGVRFSDLSLPTLNGEGQAAFRASLTGPGVSSSNNLGIWASDPEGALQLIARTGSPLEVAPGVLRTISDVQFVGFTGNSDGRASGFNNLGQLVFWARFTDGSQGVFVSNTVAHLPGDFNNDLTVDAADYVVWRKDDGTPIGYDTWRANFGRTLFTGNGSEATGSTSSFADRFAAVPEPASILLAAAGLGVLILQSRRGCHCRLAQSTGKASGTVNPTHVLEMVLVLAVSALLSQVAGATALGATIEFDSTAKSAAVIPFDPNAIVEVHPALFSGRLFSNVKGPIIGGTNVNALLGANAFHTHGYRGANAVMANIEGGHIWSGHETLAHVEQIANHPAALNEFDRHATWVGSIMGGRRGGANPGAYQEGMAPNAQLFSGATSLQWRGLRYTTGSSPSNDTVEFDQFRRAFSTGMNAAGRRADVINASWGSGGGANGSDSISIAFDGLANTNPRTLLVASAGNFGPGSDKVFSPAAAYNNMSVAALGPNPPYDQPSFFSSGGLSDYADPVIGTKNDARQVVDLAAPGQYLSAAYYGGETGGNGTTDNPAVSGTGPTGLPRGSLGGPDFYSRGGGLHGTSYAAPMVAGGATLLYDAAYSVFPDNGDARDARVIKAVLMNSADKTVGWNNAQIAHPNGNGGVITTQGLDDRVGTGRMNLATAYEQFLSGTTDVAGTDGGDLGLVDKFGWDYGQVASGTTNDYFFDSPLTAGSIFTATLTWFRDRRMNPNNTVFDDSYDDLNLELWSVVDGMPATLLSESSSLYNESEHFSFTVPATGDYALRVRWFKEVFDVIGDTNQELYGLAWWASTALGAATIPEPESIVPLAIAVLSCVLSQRALHSRRSYDEPVNTSR